MHDRQTQVRRYLVGLVALAALAVPIAAGAQGLTPQVPGMTTVADPVQQESAGAEAIAVTAIHGVGHALHFTKRLFVHGDSGGGAARNDAQTVRVVAARDAASVDASAPASTAPAAAR